MRRKNQLTWVRTRMAYTRFENIEELLTINACNRVMNGKISRDFKHR